MRPVHRLQHVPEGLILATPWNALLAWAVGVLYIPSLALAPSTWTDGREAFEWICLTLSRAWYRRTHPPTWAMRAHGLRVADLLLYRCCAVIAAVGLVLAVIGRRRELVFR